ncbi:hypothetical protein, partial [Mycobacteroides abscessus]|uniref:hypothetical protein n=1 Tax=Mycobacteroides abscessus TaxID=36809 RepID=UPI00266C3FBD
DAVLTNVIPDPAVYASGEIDALLAGHQLYPTISTLAPHPQRTRCVRAGSATSVSAFVGVLM